MKKLTDEQLTKDVFTIYVNSQTSTEFKEKLKKYIKDNKITKTPKYLKALLAAYKEKLKSEKTTPEYKMLERTREAHKNASNYKTIVEQIIQMSDEELKEYIQKNEISKIKTRFETYIKNETDSNLVNIAKLTLQKIKNIKEKLNNEQKQYQSNKRYEYAINLFDTIINNGFFDYLEFSRRMSEQYNVTQYEMNEIINRQRAYIRVKHPEIYEQYNIKLTHNAIKYCLQYSGELLRLLESCIFMDNYDIVDYYINIGLPIDTFKRLYNKLFQLQIIGQQEKLELNKFLCKYFDQCMRAIYHENPIIIDYELGYDSQEIPEKEQIIEFMKKYNIPDEFFQNCYKKYKKGELDDYITQTSKTKTKKKDSNVRTINSSSN